MNKTGRISRIGMMSVGAIVACGVGAGVMIAAGPGAAVSGAATAAALGAAAAETTFKVDASHTSVLYKVTHLGVSNFYGRFNKVDGTFSFDPANPSSASFAFTIDVNSIDSNNKQRDDHLKSPDFFSAKEHPTITFKSKELRKVGDHFELTGEMTMLGTTKAVTAKVVHTGEGDRGERFGYRAGFEATFSFKRSDFGMKYMIDNGGIGDQIDVIFAVEGIR